MSILKFLLSPILNEHGYTTLPTASIASGKPVTTGIFANIKASLDSFNDGTGIADNVIIPRHLMNTEVVATNFAFPSNDNVLLPPGWDGAVGAAGNITYSDTVAGEPATRLFCIAGSTPPTLTRKDRFINSAYSGTKYYLSGRVFIPAVPSVDANKIGWSDSGSYSAGTINGIAVVFERASGNVVLKVRKASTDYDTILQTWSLSTWYNVLIIWQPATSITVYIDSGAGFVLKATYTTTANFPTVVLFPYIGGNAQNSPGGTFDMYISQFIIGRKSI